MDSELVIATDKATQALLNLDISPDDSPRLETKRHLNYIGPVGSHSQVAQVLPRPISNEKSRTKGGRCSPKPTLGNSVQGTRNKTIHLGNTFNVVPDTQLGLTSDEIALLRYHQQQALSTVSSSSSKASSRASSQGLLLLDGSSLAALEWHFDHLMQSIQAHLDNLSEQSQMVAQQRYDHAGNAIEIADSEISRFHDILRKVDEIEQDFDRIRNIRDIVRSYRKRIEELEESDRNWVAPPRGQHRRDRDRQQESANDSQRSLQDRKDSAQKQAGISTKSVPEEVPVFCLAPTDLSSKQPPASPAIVHSRHICQESIGESGTLCSTIDSKAWSTSSNDSNELSSEGSEIFCSTTDWRHHLILEAVMKEVYKLLQHNAAIVHGAYGQGGGSSSANSSENSSSWTSGACSSTNQSSLSATSNAAGTKRSKGDDDFPPPDEDPDGYKRPRKALKDDDDMRRYACPFFKNDPRKNRRRRSCAGPGFNSISHLKEHLYRCHIAPTQCPRCWAIVGDDRGLELHLQNETRCQKQEKIPVDGISPQKLKLLKSKRRLPPIEGADGSKWSDIYRILFPGMQPIPSPYFDHENEDSNSKASSSSTPQDFGQYYQSRLPSLIETHVAQLLHERLGPVEAEMKRMVTEITRKCLSDLVRDWQASQSETSAEGDRPPKDADIGRTYGNPCALSDAPRDFLPTESAFNAFKDGPLLGSSLLSGLDASSMFHAAADPYFDFTQLGDWAHTATAESQVTDETFDIQRDPQLSSFVCLRVPQHPEPETYTGKGKGPESQDLKYCLECFPNTDIYDP